MSIAPIYFSGDNKVARQDREFLIFVEGADDAHFLDVVLSELDADPDRVGIVIVDGTTNFAPAMRSYQKTRFFKSAQGVLILRDADDDREAALRDTNDQVFKGFDLNLTHATFEERDSKRLGVYILPWENECGDLERLCLSTIEGSEEDKLAQEYMERAQAGGALPQVFKRKAQVYLAANPGKLCRGAGMGFKRGCFDAKHSVLDPLKAFLREFFLEVEVAQAAA
jgi:hypothetical protein